MESKYKLDRDDQTWMLDHTVLQQSDSLEEIGCEDGSLLHLFIHLHVCNIALAHVYKIH